MILRAVKLSLSAGFALLDTLIVFNNLAYFDSNYRNGHDAAFRKFAVAGLVLLFLLQPEGGGAPMIDQEALAAPSVFCALPKFHPIIYWLNGGQDGAPGDASLTRNTDGGEMEQELPGKCSIQVSSGNILRIKTPGSGGWGKVER
jgi:hypothetical protein